MKITGTATLGDHTTRVVLKGLDPGEEVKNLNVNYIDEDGRPSFSVNGFTTADPAGAVDWTIDLGKTEVQSYTHKDIDHIEVTAEIAIVLESHSD